MPYYIVCLVPQYWSSITSPAFRGGCAQVFIIIINTLANSLSRVCLCVLSSLTNVFSYYSRHLLSSVPIGWLLAAAAPIDRPIRHCRAVVMTDIFFTNRNKIEFVKLVSSNLKYRPKYRFKRMQIAPLLGNDREVRCQLNMSHGLCTQLQYPCNMTSPYKRSWSHTWQVLRTVVSILASKYGLSTKLNGRLTGSEEHSSASHTFDKDNNSRKSQNSTWRWFFERIYWI